MDSGSLPQSTIVCNIIIIITLMHCPRQISRVYQVVKNILLNPAPRVLRHILLIIHVEVNRLMPFNLEISIQLLTTPTTTSNNNNNDDGDNDYDFYGLQSFRGSVLLRAKICKHGKFYQ